MGKSKVLNYSGGKVNFPKISPAQRITSGPKEHLLANYYGINPFDSKERYLMVLETSIQDHNPKTSEAATLGIVDLKDNNKFIPLTKTYSWNFQQGCMLHWLSDELIIYNDRRSGKFVSIIRNIFAEEEKIIPYPISAVTPDRKFAISINFARLHITRPGYGYAGEGQNARLDKAFPTNDGLFLIDLNSGKSKLILSIAEVKKLVPPLPENSIEYFNHTLFNKDGSRIFFLARCSPGPRNTVAFTINREGTNLCPVFPEGWGGSHFDWLISKKLMITCKFQGKKWTHVLFTDGKKDYQILGGGMLSDGHGTFSPNKKWMVTDTDPDELRMQTLILMDMTTNALLPLGRFYEPPKFKDSWRCDLHPHWSPKSDMIAFNSTHEGTRQVYVISLEEGNSPL